MKNLFGITKNYETALTTQEINDFITTRLSNEPGLFTNSMLTGTHTTGGFNVVFFKKLSFFQIRITAKISTGDSGTLLAVKYRPTIHPLVILIPVWIFFLYGFFAPVFTINGEEANFLNRSLFIVIGLLISSFLVIAAARYSIRASRDQLQKDLKLREHI